MTPKFCVMILFDFNFYVLEAQVTLRANRMAYFVLDLLVADRPVTYR